MRRAKAFHVDLQKENLLIKQAIQNKEQWENSFKTKGTEIELLKSDLNRELQNIATEKLKIDEKNKKIWKMSEAALKESHRLDEANQVLETEKVKLEADKKKLDEKIKKLWQTSLTIHKEKERISELNELLAIEKDKSENLLLNILPFETAQELKETGASVAKLYDAVTIIFTDFKGFTSVTETLTPSELVAELDYCFGAFDKIMERHHVEKIKTIGDAYMAAGGLPVVNNTHAQNVVGAAIEMMDFIRQYNDERVGSGKMPMEMRIGIHTGPVVAGIVGLKKFAYDIWGDSVNIASRMESSGQPGKINISETTYAIIKDDFICEYRGKVEAKNKGLLDMYFVNSIKL